MHVVSVTLTGADNTTDPYALVDLSRRYPFVEWGILISKGQRGHGRYPSSEWVEQLCTIKLVERLPLRLSAHLCGQYARNFMSTSQQPSFFDEYDARAFERVQINGFPAFSSRSILIARNVIEHADWEFIFQISNNDAFDQAEQIHRLIPDDHHVQVLFDKSGGRGELPEDWPTRKPFGYCGYAGGLGPTTIWEQLDRISHLHFDEPIDIPFWIDMESSMRTDDRFDLALAEEVLYQVAKYRHLS